MGIKPVETKVFLEYLKYLGLICIRYESSHYVYDFPKEEKQLERPVIVRINYQHIPVFHIHTNLLSLGKTHRDFETWLNLPKKERKK